MTIKQLKKVHAEIMDLIIKSGSGSATVTFRRFDDGSFMVSFYDTDFMQPGKPDTVWSNHSDLSEGQKLIERVREFLFPESAQPELIPVPEPREYRHTMAQMFPKKYTPAQLDDEPFYG